MPGDALISSSSDRLAPQLLQLLEVYPQRRESVDGISRELPLRSRSLLLPIRPFTRSSSHAQEPTEVLTEVLAEVLRNRSGSVQRAPAGPSVYAGFGSRGDVRWRYGT